MFKTGTLPLIGSLILFCIFFTNVAFGAARMGVFMGDVAEMLTLFASAILFVIGVLGREAVAKENENGRTET